MKKTAAFVITLFCLSLLLANPTVASQESSAARLLAEINLARSKPHIYAEYLYQLRKTFNGKLRYAPGKTSFVRTSEGTAAVDEAIRYMLSRKALPPLNDSVGLSFAAAELARNQEKSGAVGHSNIRNQLLKKRVERYGNWESSIAESIIYSPVDPRGMVMQLIIDDGVPGREHRSNLFSNSFSKVGIFCGPHPKFEGVCVINFAGDFHDHPHIFKHQTQLKTKS